MGLPEAQKSIRKEWMALEGFMSKLVSQSGPLLVCFQGENMGFKYVLLSKTHGLPSMAGYIRPISQAHKMAAFILIDSFVFELFVVLFDTGLNCLFIWTGNEWECFLASMFGLNSFNPFFQKHHSFKQDFFIHPTCPFSVND